MKKWSYGKPVIFMLLLLVSGGSAGAEYLKPPPEVANVLERKPFPEVSVSPDRENMLLIQREGMPGMEEMSRPFLALGGRRFIPENLGPVADRRGSIVGISLLSIRSGQRWEVEFPEEVNPEDPVFSPDGKWLAFVDIQQNGISLWIVEIGTGKSRLVSGSNLNLVTGGFTWLPDSSGLLCRTRPEGAGNPPEKVNVPEGPLIQETSKVEAKARTYQDLLKNPHDLELFDYYFTSQLMIFRLGGRNEPIGEPAVFADASVSPDGKYLLVTRIKKPYSYLVPWWYFARETEVWDTRKGEKVATVADLDRTEGIPIEGVPEGPRDIEWRADASATLVWAEALDGGDPGKDVPHRDRIMLWRAPFRGEPGELLKSAMRYSRIMWGSGDQEFLFTGDRIKQWTRTWVFSTRGEKLDGNKLLWDRDRGDAYGDPGNLVSHFDGRGRRLVVEADGNVLLTGAGSSPEGDHPFLDEMQVDSAETRRIFQNRENAYETVVEVLDSGGREIVTRYETVSTPPVYYLRDTVDGAKRVLLSFDDPVPELKGVSKQIIKYLRKDGVELSGTLYLPPGYEPGERLPLIMWAYPREYNNPGIAAQVRGSAFRFPVISGASHLYFLLRGYAVLDGPSMPVVGERGNDTFVEQLVMNAKAAVDKVVAMGVADRERIGIGGHSYGAFMTANLLAHSDFFAAGIARSGAYNRTLTPFGFQNERRTFWEAPEVYFAMSPFMHADQINEPLLMIHGEADNNSGTFPIQSRRMFHALKGLGGTARLVFLPCESHGYAARESNLHAVYEMLEWADRFVKSK